jgi:thiol-disulfide isomerase/thioredoxin
MSPESTVADIAPQAGRGRFGSRGEFQSQGKLEAAAAELEQSRPGGAAPLLTKMNSLTRIRLGMMLADIYLALNRLEDARSFLAEEAAFAERISQLMQATGTPNQKRQAMSGYLQVRDRTAQIGLLGNPAPEVNLKMWLVGDPVTLADLRGKVVMLEFWATWCKPCQEMFPKLTSLYEQESKNGLEILGITRHYMAYGGTLEARNEELDLIRKTVSDHRSHFPGGRG